MGGNTQKGVQSCLKLLEAIRVESIKPDFFTPSSLDSQQKSKMSFNSARYMT